MPNHSEWMADEPRGVPLPVSGLPEKSQVSDHDRDAELLGGLAQRNYDLRQQLELDRRLTWEQLYEMFRGYNRVTAKKATEWADTITARGVRQR